MIKQILINSVDIKTYAMKRIIGIFILTVFSGFISVSIYKAFEKEDNSKVQVIQEQLPVFQASYTPPVPVVGPDFVEAADKSVHAVVHIKSELRRRNQVYNSFFDFFNDYFYGNPGVSVPIIATGSGVIISPDGYIVTNNHVVQETARLEVTLNDNRTFEAELIGNDPSTDLALIKIDADNLPFLNYGNSDDLKVGEWVLAVGNPFNLTSTVTAGIVSAKARNINILGSNTAIESFIQTDAAVNRGNSGGALVNTKGELVGINAAIASNTGNYTGYSFAIPVNIVKKVMEDFMNYGGVQRAYLGITFAEIDSEFAKERGLDEVKGVYVVDVLDNSAAESAGLKPGDVIVKIDNSVIDSKSSFLESIGTHRPGDKIEVEVMRDGKPKKLEVTLTNSNGNTDIIKNSDIRIFGASFKPLTEKEMYSLRIDHGIKVVNVAGGKFRDAGIREGFIILYVDNKPINSVDDLKNEIEGKRGGVLIEGIYPNGQSAYYGIGI